MLGRPKEGLSEEVTSEHVPEKEGVSHAKGISGEGTASSKPQR